MKTYKEWLNEIIVEQWAGTGLLEGVQNKQSLAYLLEGQRRYNEENDMDAQWLRCSIPLARRIFENGMVEGSVDVLPNWYTFPNVMWNSTPSSLDSDTEQTAMVADQITNQLRAMGKIAVHCLKRMDDGSIAMNYQ